MIELIAEQVMDIPVYLPSLSAFVLDVVSVQSPANNHLDIEVLDQETFLTH